MKFCQFTFLTTWLLVYISPLIHANGRNRISLEHSILEDMLDPSRYNRRIRPPAGNETDAPTVVKVNMFIRNIEAIDDVKMEWKLQVTLRQKWMDERLRYDDTKGIVEYLTLTETDLIWMPDLFINNEREGHFHNVVAPNMYLRIFSDGTVLYSRRLSLTLMCPMDLKLYPMDHQRCQLLLAPYAHTTDDIVLLWKAIDPVQITKNLHLPHFSLYRFSTDYCNSRTNTGTYSCLNLELSFRREFSHYLLNIYVPCTMFVIIAYLVFYLDSRAITARATIATISLAVISMGCALVNQAMPPVAYTKAIDVWTGMCVTFVFAALCEVVLVNFLNPASPDDNTKFHNLGRLVDIVSRIGYPAAFLLFNIIYWPTYLNVDHQEQECPEHLQSCYRTGY